MYPSIYNSFHVIRTASAKNRHFYVPRPSFFVCPGDAPVAITQNVTWMKRQFSACQTPRSMYLSIFNSFRAIRFLSQCVSPKIAILPHFCYPWGRLWGNHAKCCMDEKWIRCLQIVSQHVPVSLQQFPSYSNRKCKKSPFSHTAAHIFVSPGDAPGAITLNVAWIERAFDAYKLPRCICPYNYNRFWDRARYWWK